MRLLAVRLHVGDVDDRALGVDGTPPKAGCRCSSSTCIARRARRTRTACEHLARGLAVHQAARAGGKSPPPPRHGSGARRRVARSPAALERAAAAGSARRRVRIGRMENEKGRGVSPALFAVLEGSCLLLHFVFFRGGLLLLLLAFGSPSFFGAAFFSALAALFGSDLDLRRLSGGLLLDLLLVLHLRAGVRRRGRRKRVTAANIAATITDSSLFIFL